MLVLIGGQKGGGGETTSERITARRVSGKGMGVTTEYRPIDVKAVNEINVLYDEVFNDG